MSFADPNRDASVPVSVLEEVDRLCDAFETALLAKEAVVIEGCLRCGDLDEQYRPIAYRELLALELAYRQWADQQAAEADYTKRFPEYAAVTRDFFATLQRKMQVDSAGEEIPVSPPSTGGRKAGVVSNDPLPDKIGKYRIVERLGSGGQGVVYRAIHPELHRDVVIKVSHRRFEADEAGLRQLMQEGRVLSGLDHPNLMRIHDLDFDQGRPYLVMDFVRGQTLRQYAEAKPVSPKAAAELVLRLTDAMKAVHAQGVIHFDIRPENILVDDSGDPRLVDFGLATLRAWWASESDDEKAFRGTVGFASPEQASGKETLVDQRSDIFSLGAVLYFLLVGRPPYKDADWRDALAKAQACDFDREAIVNCGAPRELTAICLKAMNRDPKDRYAADDEFAHDLKRFSQARPKRAAYLAGGGLLAAAILAGSVYFASILSSGQNDGGVAADHGMIASPEASLVPAAGASGAPPHAKEPLPEWDRQARELRFAGKVVRRVKSLNVAANVVAVLDRFQMQGWPRRIPSPFEGEIDRQRLNDTVRSLNEGLDEIRFCVDGEKPGILWLPPLAKPKEKE